MARTMLGFIRVVLPLFAAAVVSLPGSAAAADFLPVIATDPANGASVAVRPRFTSPTFTVTLSSGGFSFLEAEVASQPTIGADGSLADEFRVGTAYVLTAGASTPTVYQGSVFGDFSSTPGTYYWQASGRRYYPECADGAFSCTSVSPVYTLTVAAVPPPVAAPVPVAVPTVVPAVLAAPPPTESERSAPLTRRDARLLIPELIREATGRGPADLRVSRCVQKSRYAVRCFGVWGGGPLVWGGDLTVTVSATNSISYRFSGVRARKSCLRAGSVDECARVATFTPAGVRGATPSAAPPRPVVRQAPQPVASAPPPTSNCDPSYPGVCIPPAPPDLDCADVPYTDFTVIGSDPHGFDGDNDGMGCESP
jgi:hypothetical protein